MDIQITLKEKQLFHSIDRELYWRLVVNLNWAIPQARQVIALWLWFEEIGFHNIVVKMLSLSNTVLRYVIDEAMVCIHCVKTGNIPPPPLCDIPLTMNLLGKNIALEFFRDYKKIALEGMIRNMQNIYYNVFEDIEQKSLPHALQATSNVTNVGVTAAATPMMWPYVEGGGGSGMVVDGREPERKKAPMSFRQARLNVNARPWNERVAANERTMFLTFSRGHPLSEEEVIGFLTGLYGDCIETLSMQRVTSPHEEPLYAHVIFKRASTVTLLLDGMGKAKFYYNGKHIWARRWEKRDHYHH
ncbi:hypothetical protein NE237_029305 [Protea cynaroides]|uniref:Uncharacterized protein n=1 Tax=Protea cynaroides TaxID=273540 RepID=A0A9Q0JW49_9MAGN|nr:hypothetical protein NE237_029305 [Protea cynaroides]